MMMSMVNCGDIINYKYFPWFLFFRMAKPGHTSAGVGAVSGGSGWLRAAGSVLSRQSQCALPPLSLSLHHYGMAGSTAIEFGQLRGVHSVYSVHSFPFSSSFYDLCLARPPSFHGHTGCLSPASYLHLSSASHLHLSSASHSSFPPRRHSFTFPTSSPCHSHSLLLTFPTSSVPCHSHSLSLLSPQPLNHHLCILSLPVEFSCPLHSQSTSALCPQKSGDPHSPSSSSCWRTEGVQLLCTPGTVMQD